MITKKIVPIVLTLIFLLPLAFANNQCESKILEKKCSGNFIVLKVLESDCSTHWKIGAFCPYGCEYGECISEKTLPRLYVSKEYQITEDNPFITFTIHNLGTRGTVYLYVEGNASKWIEIPRKITLESNETKDLVAVVHAPNDIKGSFTFTIHAKGSADYYAPSVLVINPSSKKIITGTYGEGNIWFSGIIVLVLVLLFYFTKHKTVVAEESF